MIFYYIRKIKIQFFRNLTENSYDRPSNLISSQNDKKEIIVEKLKMFGFDDKISEFSERFDNYKDIVMKELS